MACVALAFTSGCGEDSPIAVKSVSFYTSTTALPLGETKRLIAVIKPAEARYDAITWTSSDPSIATVDARGTITSVAIGWTTITVTVADRSTTCEVEVMIPATKIELDLTEKKLIIGESQQLKATIEPANTTQTKVRWESSNPLIASVSDDGLVQALAGGTATITASVTDKLKAQCAVTVKAGSGEAWNIGDFYDVKGVKGVVVETINDGVNGKIVSLDERAFQRWATQIDQIGCVSLTDGMANTLKAEDFDSTLSVLPTFKWCVERGEDWYMPAIEEVLVVLRRSEVINATLVANGGKEITDNYWSSTESSSDSASALVGNYNSGNPTSQSNHKTIPAVSRNVRAMYAF